jgi:hypothetical protein
MSNSIHRKSAESARATAAASDLLNVRERHLRSAAASDALAEIEERATANAQVRLSEAAMRKSFTDPSD